MNILDDKETLNIFVLFTAALYTRLPKITSWHESDKHRYVR